MVWFLSHTKQQLLLHTILPTSLQSQHTVCACCKMNCACDLLLTLVIVLPGFLPAMRPDRLWHTLSRDHPLNRLVQPASTCIEQSTQWSACSQSCGAGVSTRVSNQNPACKLQMETRLCKVRPCNAVKPAPRKPMVSSTHTLLPSA